MGQAQFAVCSACHGAQGEGNVMLNAPKLAGQPDWYVKCQSKNFKHGIRGADASDAFGMQVAPMAATLVDDAAIANVAAYIASPAGFPAAGNGSRDSKRGEDFYVTCQACHGAAGQGIWSMSAPRLSRVNDWYLVRQLQNYKQGIRGAHPSDLHGKQMRLVSGVLRDDQSINDTVAYINQL